MNISAEKSLFYACKNLLKVVLFASRGIEIQLMEVKNAFETKKNASPLEKYCSRAENVFLQALKICPFSLIKNILRKTYRSAHQNISNCIDSLRYLPVIVQCRGHNSLYLMKKIPVLSINISVHFKKNRVPVKKNRGSVKNIRSPTEKIPVLMQNNRLQVEKNSLCTPIS